MIKTRTIMLDRTKPDGRYEDVVEVVNEIAAKNGRSTASEAARLLRSCPEFQRMARRLRRNGKAGRNGR